MTQKKQAKKQQLLIENSEAYTMAKLITERQK